MSDLNVDLKKKLLDLYNNKRFSEIEFELELLGDLEKQSPSIMMTYAVAKTLNLKSKKEDYEKAAYYFEKVYIFNKNNLDALYNLIIVSTKSRAYDYVMPHLIERYRIEKKDQKVIWGLSKINFMLGNISESFYYLSKLIKINPNYPDAFTEYLLISNYISSISQEEHFKQTLEFDRLLNTEIKPLIKIDKNIKKKIKLAFLSPDFKTHSVSFFLRDFLSKINKNDFEILAFSNLEINYHDEMTNELKLFFDEWYDIKKMSDSELVNLARSQNIDILIDLAGFTFGNRIQALRTRCSPIQISWLGYCNTLGIKNMDYIIVDLNLIKKEEQSLYSEKILYLPKIWSVMSKQKNLPDINNLPAKQNSIFTFGSFNNFAKLSDETIKLWSKILNNTNSRLILKTGSKTSALTFKNILKKFNKHDVQENKILILNKNSSRKEHLSEYNNIDIALDPFPFPGVTTTFEAITMGVPVLTMRGSNFNSRCGESINLNLGMNEFIARDEKDYFDKAVELQKNLKKLELLRRSLREKALNSPLFDVNKFTIDFTSILKRVWNNHINN
jgi:protein O-GlcNAc transferase